MLVNPRLLFLYWVMDASLRAALEGASDGAQARLEVSADGRSFNEAARHEFDFRAPSWYLPNATLDCLVRARLGLAQGGAFRELLRTNAVRVPRQGAGREPEAWAALPDLRRRPGARPRLAPRPAEAKAPPGPPAPAPRPPSSPGSASRWEPGPRPGAAPGAASGAASGAAGRVEGLLCFVLHSHLPFVRHPQRRYFLEEQWLFEAISETYLPLLDMLEHLAQDRVPARLTLSLTPTLMAMLRDPLLTEKYARHLQAMCELARREIQRTRRDPRFGPLAGFYGDRLERHRHLFGEVYGRDLVGRFAALEAEGQIELVCCAATHGLLPSLAVTSESVRAQIEVGVGEHERQIGRPPRGIWLPECGYFEGLDAILADAGLEFFFVDAHAVRNASSPARYGLHAPLFCPAGVAAFGRDEDSSVQVWSAFEGYPGDPAYRDFYRDIGFDLDYAYVAPYLDPAGTRGMTGFKYHRITGRTDHKEPYDRAGALRTLDRHAHDFLAKRALQVRHLGPRMDRPPLVVAMYDAELYGHWWFEGPEWLEAVLRRLGRSGLRAVTPSDYLAEHPVGQVAEPSASSWGERGYYDVWIEGSNDWILPPLHEAGRRMAEIAARPGARDASCRRILAQAGRELLLAQASDWPFILKNRTAADFARRRARQHLHRFDLLAHQIEDGAADESLAAGFEAEDNLFPRLDPGVWRSP